jgi:hypothetical protein
LIEFCQEVDFDGIIHIFVGESINEYYPVSADGIDEAIDRYFGIYEDDEDFEDFEDTEEEDDKPSKHNNEKLLEIQFDD